MKKRHIILFFVMYTIHSFSMEDVSCNKIIDYKYFFELCKKGRLSQKKEVTTVGQTFYADYAYYTNYVPVYHHSEYGTGIGYLAVRGTPLLLPEVNQDLSISIEKFIQQNPTIDVNYQNEDGITPLLHAATWGSWDVVRYLLKQCGADKMLKDNYGQTLFSTLVYYHSSTVFQEFLSIYSLSEINTLCKTMCLKRDMKYPEPIRLSIIDPLIKQVLEDEKPVDIRGERNITALHIACIHKQIPLIVRLLERGADLDIKDDLGESPYSALLGEGIVYKKAPLFVVREAFNEDSFLTNVTEESFDSPKARIWKYVCVDACKILGTLKDGEKIDEKRCLETLMLLPQKALTKINIQLALQDK